MGILDFLFSSPKAETACDVCVKSFAQMWAAYNRLEDSVPGDDVYQGRSEPVPTAVPAAERLVAIGDIHGDYYKAVRAFRLAGLTDEHGRWSGGNTVAVQVPMWVTVRGPGGKTFSRMPSLATHISILRDKGTLAHVGDILDRGDHEIRILIMLERLAREAEAAGGKLYLLNGNHETMNVMGDHRYATPGANLEVLGFSTWRDFTALMKRRSGCPAPDGQPDPLQERREAAAQASSTSATSQMSRLRPYNWLRSRALQPGGEIARRFFAARSTVLQVGDNVFVHGGVLPAHVEYGLERINRETQSWMLGGPDGPSRAPSFLRGGSAIVWARAFSASDERRCDCETLRNVLESIPGARRMVVGHTVQTRGINSACESRVIRVDVGMSHGCGDGPVEVLEVLKDGQVQRLREHGPPTPVGPSPPRHLQHVSQQPHSSTHGGKETRAGSISAAAASTAA